MERTVPIHNILLIGFMGTGKSTVGLKLAEQLGWTFVDTDQEIVKQAGRTIPQIFAEDGEGYFRELESEVICQVLSGTNQVVSFGGGAVLNPVNCTNMQKNGCVITLTAPLDTIVERVQGDTNRPLLQGDVRERVATMMEQRQGLYDFSDFNIDTTMGSADELVALIQEQFGKISRV
ncbi:shikimate kinase [Paenibacillus sp. N1-5-1-14]|uniref:shikimate kinase n=1 Tax=Paenibacillus radicibacter TaxID=2972488 RepID=UPI00215989EF|nr:shikimate kinase [Paenibacillus radicibacter]MCR8641852.1 shikimate kinase [Paenibacillus radicibacter]